MTDFYTDLETGKRGEKMLAAALAARGHKVNDESGNKEYQRKDIDFTLENKSG